MAAIARDHEESTTSVGEHGNAVVSVECGL
jgi:hypothetical protein